MIKEVTMYSVVCDGCDITYIDDHRGYSAMGDPDSIAEMAVADGWHMEEVAGSQKCYCPSCHEVIDNDNLILKPRVDKDTLST